MSVLGKYGPNALKYWGAILASAYAGKSTSEMWDAIHAQQQQYGLDKPGASAPDVSVLRGYANRIANAAGAFAAASPSDTLTSDMMAIAPYTMSTHEGIATTPTYQVNYRAVIERTDGTVVERWLTSVYTSIDMPDTVGGVLDAIQADATELAAQGSDSDGGTPRGKLLSVSDHEIKLI